MFDAYVLMQAQEQLALSDAQYAPFLTRLKALQAVRRRGEMQRMRLINELRRVTQPGGKADEAQIRGQLQTLADIESRTAAETKQAMEAVDECGAPVVVIAGGEPLIHKELPQIVRGIMAKKKYAIVCTNAILLEKKMDEYEPSPYFTWSVHLDGDKEMHDKSVCRGGIYDKAVSAIAEAKRRGFRVTINCTFFQNADPDRIATFFDDVTALVKGIEDMAYAECDADRRSPVEPAEAVKRSIERQAGDDAHRMRVGAGRAVAVKIRQHMQPATQIEALRLTQFHHTRGDLCVHRRVWLAARAVPANDVVKQRARRRLTALG